MSTQPAGMVSSRTPMGMSTGLWYTSSRITQIYITGTVMAEIREAVGIPIVAESPIRTSGKQLPDGWNGE